MRNRDFGLLQDNILTFVRASALKQKIGHCFVKYCFMFLLKNMEVL